MSYTLAGSPLSRVEPITLARTKRHLRFTSTSEDDLIDGWIATARALFEDLAGRQIIDAVYDYVLDAFPWDREIEVPRPPLTAVESITYLDADGVEQTLDPATYRVLPSLRLEGSPPSGVIDPHCRCGRIELVPGANWPTVSPIWQQEAVRIRRTCGYGETADDIPNIIQSALYLLVGHYHRNRSEITDDNHIRPLPMGASMILESFRWTAMQTLVPRRPFAAMPAGAMGRW